MDETQAERLAVATHTHRPDWPLPSLRSFIAGKLAPAYAYRDAALALTYVALDPDTKTPARVLEAGPWWTATRDPDEPTRVPPRYDSAAHGRARAHRTPSEDATTQLAAARQAIHQSAEATP